MVNDPTSESNIQPLEVTIDPQAFAQLATLISDLEESMMSTTAVAAGLDNELTTLGKSSVADILKLKGSIEELTQEERELVEIARSNFIENATIALKQFASAHGIAAGRVDELVGIVSNWNQHLAAESEYLVKDVKAMLAYQQANANAAQAAKTTFDPKVLEPFLRGIQAISKEIEHFKALHNELAAIGKFASSEERYPQAYEKLKGLAESNAQYGAIIGNVKQYYGRGSELFGSEEGELSRLQQIETKVGTYINALQRVQSAQDAIAKGLVEVGNRGDEELVRVANDAQRASEELAVLEAATKAASQQEQSANESEAQDAAKAHDKMVQRIADLHQELSLLQARAAIIAIGGKAAMSEEQLRSIPFTPSEFYQEPGEMISSMLRSYIGENLNDPELADALLGRFNFAPIRNEAMSAGTRMHELAEAQVRAMQNDSLIVEKKFKRFVDESGRIWNARADLVDKEHKSITDYKTVSTKGTLEEIEAFTTGAKAWGDLSRMTKAYIAQLVQYRNLVQKETGKTYSTQFARMPTQTEIGPEGEYRTEASAVRHVLEQVLSPEKAQRAREAGAGMVYKIPEEAIKRVNMEEALAITEQNRELAIQDERFKLMIAYLNTIVAMDKERVAQAQALNTEKVKEQQTAQSTKAHAADYLEAQRAAKAQQIAQSRTTIAELEKGIPSDTKSRISKIQEKLNAARKEEEDAAKRVAERGKYQPTVDLLLTVIEQKTSSERLTAKRLKSLIERAPELSTQSQKQFAKAISEGETAESQINQLKQEKEEYQQDVRKLEAAKQRVAVLEQELASESKITSEESKSASASEKRLEAERQTLATLEAEFEKIRAAQESATLGLSVEQEKVIAGGVPTQTREKLVEDRAAALTETVAKGDVEAMKLVTSERQRQVVLAQRTLEFAQRELKLHQETPFEGSKTLYLEKEKALKSQVASLTEQRKNQQALLDLENKLLTAAKARAKELETAKKAQEVSAVGEVAPKVQREAEAVVARLQGTKEGTTARTKAIEDVQKQKLEVEKLIITIEKELVTLTREYERKKRAAQTAEAHARSLEAEAEAARRAFEAQATQVSGRSREEDDRRVIALRQEAQARDQAASAARVQAQATSEEANAAKRGVDQAHANKKAHEELRTGLRMASQEFKAAGKAADGWQDSLFSIRKITTVFWGSLLSQVAYGFMNIVQQFFAQAIELGSKAESSVKRFEVMIRSTQRELAQGFPGADTSKTVGEFAGTIDEWSETVDAFGEKWKQFTGVQIRSGFKELLAITRSSNLGKEMQDQLADVAVGLTMLEEEFAGDLPKAMTAIGQAIEGYTRPLRGTFINMIDEVDQNRKALDLYGKTYSQLGGANQELKKHQQSLVNTEIILERYKSVGDDVSFMTDTLELRMQRADASIAETATTIGTRLTPAMVNLKGVLAKILEGLDTGIGTLDIVGRMIQSMTANGEGIKDALGFYGDNPFGVTEGDIALLTQYADVQTLILGRTGAEVKQEIVEAAEAGKLAYIEFAGAVVTKNYELAQSIKDITEVELAQLIAQLRSATDWVERVDLSKKIEVKQSVIDSMSKVAKGIKDTDEAAQHLKDTMSTWDPVVEVDITSIIDKIEQAYEDSQDRIVEAGDDRKEKLEESWQKYLDDLAKAWQDHNENLVKIAEKAEEDITEAREKAADNRLKALDDYEDAVEDENADYADRLADLDRKQQEDKEDKHKKHLQKLEDIEIDHIRKLRDLQSQYEFDLDEAAHNRDARQVLNLMRKHSFDVRQEETNYQDRIDDENRRYAREQEDSEKDDTLERQRLEREHRRKLEELKEQYEERLKEIEKALRKEIEEIREKEQESIVDENDRYAKQRRDIKDSYDKRDEDIENAYQKQLRIIEKGLNKQEKEILRSLNKQVDWTKDKMDALYNAIKDKLNVPNGEITKLYRNWFDYIQDYMNPSMVIPSGPSRSIPSNTPEGPAPEPSDYNPAAGIPTNVPVSGSLLTVNSAPQNVNIRITADDNFSQRFEADVINKITEVVNGLRAQ